MYSYTHIASYTHHFHDGLLVFHNGRGNQDNVLVPHNIDKGYSILIFLSTCGVKHFCDTVNPCVIF